MKDIQTKEMYEFKQQVPQFQQHNIVSNGDIRTVNLPVQVLFEWSDKIVSGYDNETDTVLEYSSGYIMKLMPNQQFVHKGEKTIFIAQTTIQCL